MSVLTVGAVRSGRYRRVGQLDEDRDDDRDQHDGEDRQPGVALPPVKRSPSVLLPPPTPVPPIVAIVLCGQHLVRLLAL